MRILALRVRDFRGIHECAVPFSERGVTVIEGPNEIGKSSLAFAFDLLIDELDSAKKANVRATQPVDRDVGPEVEAEIASGPYRFTYRKRFLKRPETVLTVHAPEPQNLTGREAHERVLAILGETIDFGLWKALRVLQGEGLAQAKLADAGSLAKALDKVAGQETAGERELDLFERAEAEYRRYFTPGGQPAKAHLDLAARAEEAQAEHARLSAELQAVETLVERSAEIERELASLRRDVAESGEAARRRTAEAAAIAKREEQLRHLEMEVKSRTMASSLARSEQKTRDELVQRAGEASKRREKIESEVALRTPALKEAEERARAAAEQLALAEKSAREADAIAQIRAKDFEYQRAQLELVRLVERQGYVEAAQKKSAEARRYLEECRVTEKALKELRALHLALVQAEAQLDAESPQVEVRAERKLELRVDGEERSFAPEEVARLAVPERLRLELPGQLSIEVRSGAGSEKLTRGREKARGALLSALDAGGVRGLEEAEEAFARSREAKRAIAAADEEIKKNLRDLKPQQLAEKILNLRVWESYPNERPPAPPLAPDHDSAHAAKDVARLHLEATVPALEAARERSRVAEDEHGRRREGAREAAVELRVGVEAEKAAQRELQGARAKREDPAIAADLAERVASEATAQEALARERASLGALHPESVRQLAENAARAAKSAAESLARREKEGHGVEAQLDLLSGRGLFDAREEAHTALERALQERDAAERRARAAGMLFLTMRRKREEAREAYRAPLREKIEELGRLLFDASFTVELDETLSIVHRTLNGRTVPFESLSGGAREQLSLMTRLAAALLVSHDDQEGVPLVLDDTLGSTDPSRLEGMGAMLALAGERCQVIVLTCTPGRFLHVGGATTVRLGSGTQPV